MLINTKGKGPMGKSIVAPRKGAALTVRFILYAVDSVLTFI